MAGLMEWPRSLVHGYFRLVGLVFLIVYGLWMRLWDSVKPSLSPVLNIYHTIDSEEVNIPTIVQQFAKFVLMVGVLYWKTAMAIWDTVSRPFRKQVDDAARFLEDIRKEYKEVTIPSKNSRSTNERRALSETDDEGHVGGQRRGQLIEWKSEQDQRKFS